MHSSEIISQINREIIGYSNLVFPSFSLSQTFIKLPEFNSQSMGLGHILPMGIQNNWRNQIVVEDYQIQPSSSYFDNLKSSSSNYNKYIPSRMGSNIPDSGTKYKDRRKKRNKKIIPREKPRNIIRKTQSI
jgi:hypothetical protein